MRRGDSVLRILNNPRYCSKAKFTIAKILSVGQKLSSILLRMTNFICEHNLSGSIQGILLGGGRVEGVYGVLSKIAKNLSLSLSLFMQQSQTPPKPCDTCADCKGKGVTNIIT